MKEEDPLSSPFGCKCETLAHNVLGDGCDICNPELAKEIEEDMEQIRNESKLDVLAKQVKAAGLDNADYNPHNAHMKDKETLGVWGIISHKKRWLTWGGSHDRATDFMRDLQEDIKFEGYDLSLIYFESEEDLNNHEYN